MSRLPFGAPPPARQPAPARGSREAPWSVAALSTRIGRLVEDGFPPRGVWVEGEVTEAPGGGRGHVYLTLSGQDARLNAIIWASTRARLAFIPKRGDRVRARGRITTYAGRSRYQLIIGQVERAGAGRLLRELKELEARLEREGLFDPRRRKALPFLPRRVGLLTAIGSDAYRDFLRHARERFPGLVISERNTRVQGPRAAPDLIAGIRWLGARDLDLIVVARGGGSTEDLLSFSDEGVLRAASRCPAPLVSAIGHEADHPLLDRVADYRAATPTAAAKEAIPRRADLLDEIRERLGAARHAARSALSTAEARLGIRRSHRATQALPTVVRTEGAARERERDRARALARRAIDRRETRLREVRTQLESDHPQSRLRRHERTLGRLRERIAGTAPLRRAETAVQALGNRARSAFVKSEARVRAEDDALRRERERTADRTGAVLARTGERIGSRRRSLRDRNPRRVLEQGYSLALDRRGRPIRSAETVAAGARIRLLLGRGELGVRVEKIHPGPDGAGPAGDAAS